MSMESHGSGKIGKTKTKRKTLVLKIVGLLLVIVLGMTAYDVITRMNKARGVTLADTQAALTVRTTPESTSADGNTGKPGSAAESMQRPVNIKVMYHSTTGNTQKLAHAIAESLNVKPEPIANESIAISTPIDLLFLGDGIYFGKPHETTIKFIEGLSPDMVRNAAVFATYGGQSEIGADMVALLEKRGINVFQNTFICGGQSWLLVNRQRPDESDLENARKYAQERVAEIIQKNQSKD